MQFKKISGILNIESRVLYEQIIWEVMARFRERDAQHALALSLGRNEFRRVFNSHIVDVQNFAGSWSCSPLSPVAWVIRDCSGLAAPQEMHFHEF